MHALRPCAALVAILFAAAAAPPAAAQFIESSPAFKAQPPKKKPVRRQATPPAPAQEKAAEVEAPDGLGPATATPPAPAQKKAAEFEAPDGLGPATATPPVPAQEKAAEVEAPDGLGPATATPPAPAQEKAAEVEAPTAPETAAEAPPAPAQEKAAKTEAPDALGPATATPPAPAQKPVEEAARTPQPMPGVAPEPQKSEPPKVEEPATATAAIGTVPKYTHRPPYPPPNDGCRNSESFSSWLARFKEDAAASGIRPGTINAVLDGMGVDQKVISRDRGQKFFAQSFWSFQGKLATQNRVVSGKKKIAQRKAVFERAQREYGVPPSVITGFWALESDFGAGMGNFPIMPALVTLAYDCRRQVMFQEELKAAMQIIDRGDMRPSEMIGSWAGEIGQTQFLPTRYLDHAIDYDGDGRIDLFRDDADVIGSTANYMRHLGWRPNEPWLEEVRITQDLPWEQADLNIKLPRAKWAGWGITYPDGTPVPNDEQPASLLLPMGRNGPAFLAYPNFDIYTEWNNSLTYATTAAYLATRIDGAGPMSPGRGHIPDLGDGETKEVQRLLVARGYDVGKVDGLVGEKTRAAVKDMQLKLGLPADSYPTPELLSALRRGG